MAADTFAPALKFVFGQEGGYVDDPVDPGGATNLGITLRVLAVWRHTAVTSSDVKNLGPDEAAAIYRAHYWNIVLGDSLPSGIDLMVFDAGVNLGTFRSAALLQKALGVDADGAIGPQTLAALKSAPTHAVIDRLAQERQSYYESLPIYAHFARGWTSRVIAATAAAKKLAP